MGAPTENQLRYIQRMAESSGCDVPYVADFDEASIVIKDLQKVAPVQPTTLGKVHALCKEAGISYDTVKSAIHVETLSPKKGATEAQGKRAIAWLESQIVERRRIAAIRRIPRLRCPPTEPVRPPALTEEFVPRNAVEVTPSGRTVIMNHIGLAEVERLTVGVTPANAAEVLEALRARGLYFRRSAHQGNRRWGLEATERNLLGLAEPHPFWGSVKDKYANSKWWGRNWKPEFEEIVEEEIAA